MARGHLKNELLLLVLLFLTLVTEGRANTESPPPRASRVIDPGEGKGPGDGVYGRFNGDMSLRVGVGTELDTTTRSARLLVSTDLMVYQFAGLGLSYRESLSSTDAYLRILSAGINVSPLFLLRFNQSKEWGYAYPDLLLDSLGVFLGAHFSQPRGGAFSEVVGFEGALLFGVPLLGKANGPWLRTRANLLTRPAEVNGTFFLYLAWEGFLEAGLLSD